MNETGQKFISREEIITNLQRGLVEDSGVDCTEIKGNSTFGELGMDELDKIMLISNMEKKFGISEFTDSAVLNVHSVNDYYNLFLEALGHEPISIKVIIPEKKSKRVRAQKPPKEDIIKTDKGETQKSIIKKVDSIIWDITGTKTEEYTSESILIEELNFDDLDLTMMIMHIEEEFNIRISDEQFNEIFSVGDIYKKVAENLGIQLNLENSERRTIEETAGRKKSFSILDYFFPDWKRKDYTKRINWIKNADYNDEKDRKIISDLAINDPNSKVREKAISRITDIEELKNIFILFRDSLHQEFILKKIRNEKIVYEILERYSAELPEHVNKFAVKLIKSDLLIKNIAENTNNLFSVVQKYAINKLDDQQALYKLVKNAKHSTTREDALERIMTIEYNDAIEDYTKFVETITYLSTKDRSMKIRDRAKQILKRFEKSDLEKVNVKSTKKKISKDSSSVKFSNNTITISLGEGNNFLQFPAGYEKNYENHLKYVGELIKKKIYPNLEVMGFRSKSSAVDYPAIIFVKGKMSEAKKINDVFYLPEAEKIFYKIFPSRDWTLISPPTSIGNIPIPGWSVGKEVQSKMDNYIELINTGIYKLDRKL
ncbi:MAG: hypothetical protein JW995_13705 [Melioribacteraceae bacterium]|nr:hypothetical protein [Melioribacteraceae bacterium]